jgi:hypothetical protein
MHHCDLIVAALLISTWVSAQAPPIIEWQRNLGGSGNERGASIQQTSDGGYVLCGETFSNNGDVSGNHGNSDVWVVKLDVLGNIQWQRCLGGVQFDYGRAIHEHPDGGYVVLGNTNSNNGDVSGNHGSSDIWLVRLDEGGAITWQRCYGGSQTESAAALGPSLDGGFIIAGTSRSTDGDLNTNAGSTDFWIFKVDEQGGIIWQYTYGGSSSDEMFDLATTADGGCVVIGVSSSNDGDISGNHGGEYDAWVVKLDGSGALQWQRACGGSGSDFGLGISQRSDGAFVASARTNSTDGDITDPIGANDLWTFVLSPSGELVTSGSYGGSGDDSGSSLASLANDGVLFFGSSRSTDGDLSVNQGMVDGWFLRIDADGAVRWSLALGGSLSESFTSGIATLDGGYLATGQSTSTNGDLPGNNGGGDVWVVKLGPDAVGIREAATDLGLEVHPNPCLERLRVTSTCHESGPLMWTILDARGRVAAKGTMRGMTSDIDVAALRPGVYALALQCASGSASIPFVKE